MTDALMYWLVKKKIEQNSIIIQSTKRDDLIIQCRNENLFLHKELLKYSKRLNDKYVNGDFNETIKALSIIIDQKVKNAV